MSVLSVNKLCKSFGDTQVLKGVSFDVEAGESVAIIGMSGGGKTTALRCINLLERPDSGSITVCGIPVFGTLSGIAPTYRQVREARLKIGLVFQNYNLFPQYNVLNNLCLAPLTRNNGESRQVIEDRAMNILERMGLSAKAKAYPSELSGGQQQRVAIARALMLNPEILCFDEPTAALDPQLTGEIAGIIRDMKSHGTATVVVTHDMEFAKLVADRILFFADGVIEEEGTPEELFTNPRSEKLRRFIQTGDDPDYVHTQHKPQLNGK